MNKIENLTKEITKAQSRRDILAGDLETCRADIESLRAKMGEAIFAGTDAVQIADELRRRELKAEALAAGVISADKHIGELQERLKEAEYEKVKAELEKDGASLWKKFAAMVLQVKELRETMGKIHLEASEFYAKAEKAHQNSRLAKDIFSWSDPSRQISFDGFATYLWNDYPELWGAQSPRQERDARNVRIPEPPPPPILEAWQKLPSLDISKFIKRTKRIIGG